MMWGRAAARPPRRVIIAMSLQPAIPRQVALQQSPPPLRRPPPVCVDPTSETMKLQRAEKCPLFVCRRRGVQSSAELHSSLGSPQWGNSAQFLVRFWSGCGVGVMLTNFHLPRTSLLLLACAFAGKELALAAYRHAVESGYRFYSYGDCMLVV